MKAKTKRKKRGLGRFVLYLTLILLALLVGGFLSFVRHINKLETPTSIISADGIVVWTGKGGDRLLAAGQLLEKGLGERLLISGVNEALSEEDVLKLLSIGPDKGRCCVDLDYKALDTIGNARETQYWIESLGYEHIILVTSAYHMPRASIEIRHLAGRVRITPYPVVETSDVKWWRDSGQRRRMVSEYGKLLLTYLRNAGGSAEREAPELPDMDLKKTN